MNALVEPILRQAQGFLVFNRFLPTKSCQVSFRLSFSRAASLALLREAFYSWGRVVRDDLDASEAVILTVVGSGFCNMNPTVLAATLGDSKSTQTEVLLAAHAKEGLISQRSAEKAVRFYGAKLKAAQKIEPGAAPNGGPAAPSDNSGVTEGPPSVR